MHGLSFAQQDESDVHIGYLLIIQEPFKFKWATIYSVKPAHAGWCTPGFLNHFHGDMCVCSLSRPLITSCVIWAPYD